MVAARSWGCGSLCSASRPWAAVVSATVYLFLQGLLYLLSLENGQCSRVLRVPGLGAMGSRQKCSQWSLPASSCLVMLAECACWRISFSSLQLNSYPWFMGSAEICPSRTFLACPSLCSFLPRFS